MTIKTDQSILNLPLTGPQALRHPEIRTQNIWDDGSIVGVRITVGACPPCQFNSIATDSGRIVLEVLNQCPAGSESQAHDSAVIEYANEIELYLGNQDQLVKAKTAFGYIYVVLTASQASYRKRYHPRG